MNEEMFSQFLSGSIVLCLIMAIGSTVLRWKKFGPAALALGFAFLAMAGLLYGFEKGWPQGQIAAAGVVLVLLLAADAILRSNTELRK